MPMTDNDLLALIQPDMDAARAYQSELSAEREKHYRWYRAEPYGNERPGWSQTVHPTIFSVVEWMKPGLVDVFTGEFFTFNPVVRGDNPEEAKEARDSADRLRRYVRHKLFGPLEGEQLIEDFIHDCLVNHYGVMKVTQRDDYDLTTELLPEMGVDELEALAAADANIVDIRGGKSVTLRDPASGAERPGLRGAKAVRRKSLYQGFHLEVVPPRELYMLPGYADLAKNPFVAHVVKRDLDSIRRQELAGVYRKGSAEALRARADQRRAAAETAGEYATLHEVDGMTAQGGPDGAMRPGTPEVFVWECYLRLPVDETGLLKPCIVTVCEDVILRGPVENPYGGPPFELGYVYKEPHKLLGRPVAAVLDHRQRVLSNLLRNIQDQAAMSTYRGFLTTDARARKILSGMGPGDVSLVPSLGTVQELAPSPTDRFILDAFQLTLEEVAKESGVSADMQGLDSNSLNHTALGMQMRLSAGMQRQKLYARRIARAFRRILGRVLDVIRLYPPEDDRRLVGADVFIEPEDLTGEYSVAIDVGVGPQERQDSARLMDELVQLMLKAGLQLGVCDAKGLIKAIKAKYEYLDIDVSEYLRDEASMDMVEDLKRKADGLLRDNQVMSRALGNGGSAPGAGPGAGPMPGLMAEAGPMPRPAHSPAHSPGGGPAPGRGLPPLGRMTPGTAPGGGPVPGPGQMPQGMPPGMAPGPQGGPQ